MRKIFIVIIIVLGAILVYFSRFEIKNIVQTLDHSDWRFWGMALLFELIWIYNMATDFGVLYRLMGIKEKNRHLFWVAAAANFVNVVAPSAGIGGMAVFMDDGRQRNHPTGRITVIGVLFVLYDYFAFLCLLALGWWVLIRRNNLNAGEITASFIMLGLAVGLTLMLYLGYKSAKRLGNALAALTHFINRIFFPFIHRPYLSEENARHYALEVSEGLAAIKGKRKEMIWPFLFALNNKALYLIILALCFLTFQIPFTIGTLIAGLSVAYLFVIVSPTPAGLGFVEGAMAISLSGMGISIGSAALITLTYRAVTFWFPLAVGALALRHLQSSRKVNQLMDSNSSDQVGK
jgi:glycosyltransferase 2 family protein